jgi:hypothetical protein
MAQAMCVHAPEVRAPGGIRHDAADPACSESMMGREVPDKHGPSLNCKSLDLI